VPRNSSIARLAVLMASQVSTGTRLNDLGKGAGNAHGMDTSACACGRLRAETRLSQN
jgi:hypothetical protein